jgi:ATP-dependent DNA ligase
MSSFDQYHDLMVELRATNSNKDKLEILTRYITYPPVAMMLELAYNPYKPYYLGAKKLGSLCGGGLQPVLTGKTDPDTPTILYAAAETLINRGVTGDAAVEMVSSLLQQHSPRTAAEIVRILLKDVGAGITAKTINAASKAAGLGVLIPEFSIQLAHPLKDRRLTFPVQCEYKYDGERSILDARANGRAGEYSSLSREGRPQVNNEGIWVDEIAALCRWFDVDGIVFDAETVADSFKDVAKSKKKGASKEGLRLAIFDVLSAEEWTERRCVLKQSIRTSLIAEAVESLGLTRVIVPVMRICNSMDEVQKFYEEAVAAGLEGLMIKDPGGLYEYKRSYSWLKLKPVNTADGVITELNPGKAGGKWEGKIGSYTVTGQLEDGTEFVVNVGSGLSQAVLEDINRNPGSYLSHHVELWYDAVTTADDSSIASLRFPRHHKKRADLD